MICGERRSENDLGGTVLRTKKRSERLAQAIKALHTALMAGLEARGITTVNEVVTQLRHIKAPRIDPATLRRYFDGDLPSVNRADSRANLTSLASLTAEPAVITRLWERVLEEARNPTSSESDIIAGVPRTWYAVIPASTNRAYLSVDRVDIQEFSETHLAGEMVRGWPEGKTGLRWTFSGIGHGREALFFYFAPADPQNLTSMGVAALQVQDERALSYVGSYSRLDHVGTGGVNLANRVYEWHQEIPARMAPQLSILDLDNTLRPGWSIIDWFRAMAADGDEEANRVGIAITGLIGSYRSGALTHDGLAIAVATEYERWAGNHNEEYVFADALAYVRRTWRRTLYPFAADLVKLLKERGFPAVLLTGAPQPLAQAYADCLDITWAVGCGHSSAGQLRCNGSGTSKRQFLDLMLTQRREVVVAAGDSSSDQHILDNAHVRIIVDDGVSVEESETQSTFHVASKRIDTNHLLADIVRALPAAHFVGR
jgi:phosphoserine phosphatase